MLDEDQIKVIEEADKNIEDLLKRRLERLTEVDSKHTKNTIFDQLKRLLHWRNN